METIGDPEVFAVELERDREPTYKPWMYGVFCVSICGDLLGSPLNQVTLNSILAELHGWKDTLGKRCDPALMAADPLTAFLSIEGEAYGFDHIEHMIPTGFVPIPVPPLGAFQILGVDGLEAYRIYCVEDDTTSRLIYAKKGKSPRECRIPRAVLTDVLDRTIERLDHWFAQLPEPPPSS